MEKAKVYFTKDTTSEGLIKAYKALGLNLEGKVGVKLHSGEEGNQNYLGPEFVKPIIDLVNGTVIECNTAYDGERTNNIDHDRLMEKHGWSKNFNVDILDRESSLTLAIPNGKVLKENYVGSHITNYDSILLLSHFKGHPMGGFGGALKQLSIGFASRLGKTWIHSAGTNKDANTLWNNLPEQNLFLESMADAALSVHNLFKGRIVYINTLKNMSVDCDCCAVAEDPCLNDIGVLISTDPIAIDRASLDLVKNSSDEGRKHFLERVNSRNGEHTIEAAADLGFGTTDYELINID